MPGKDCSFHSWLSGRRCPILAPGVHASCHPKRLSASNCAFRLSLVQHASNPPLGSRWLWWRLGGANDGGWDGRRMWRNGGEGLVRRRFLCNCLLPTDMQGGWELGCSGRLLGRLQRSERLVLQSMRASEGACGGGGSQQGTATARLTGLTTTPPLALPPRQATRQAYSRPTPRCVATN